MSAAALVVAAAAVTSVLVVAPGSPVAVNLSDPAPQNECTTQSGLQSSSVEGSIASGLFKHAAKMVGEEAFSFGADEGFSWVLKQITGDPEKETQQKLDEINKELADVKAQVGDLQTEMSDFHTEWTAQFQELDAAIHQTDWDTTVGDMNDYVAAVDSYAAAYNRIVGDHRVGYVLQGDDKRDLADMRSDSTGLPKIISGIIQAMHGGPGQSPIIDVWTKAVWAKGGYTGKQSDGVYTAAYIDQASAIYNYYGAEIVNALRLYANAEHVAFTYNGENYPVDTPDTHAVCDLYNEVAKALNDWSTQTSDGTGPIPAGTVVDLRSKDDPLLWSDGPITPTGGYSDWYCGTGHGYCYADQWADFSGGTRLLVDSYAVRDKLLEENKISDIGGWTDWRIPRPADLKNIQTGVTQGLDAWAHQYGAKMFDPTDVTVVGHDIHNGEVVKMIPPILVDNNAPGSGDKIYDVATGPADANALTMVPRPTIAGSTAGRVMVVRDFVRETDGGELPDFNPARLQTNPALATSAAAASKLGQWTPGASQSFTTAATCTATPYTVPADVTALQVDAVGGAGGQGGQADGYLGSPGGLGGEQSGIVPVVPGSTVYIQVGGKGGDASTSAGGVGGGGAGGHRAGGGGGLSGISTDTQCNRWLIAAGGGGGAGAGFVDTVVHHGGNGGEGGTLTRASEGGINGCQPGRPFPNGGGGQSSSACGGQAGQSGGPLHGAAGGNGAYGGGGGGAGFWVGGGGGSSGGIVKNVSNPGAGGAGGDNYITRPGPWGYPADAAKSGSSTAAAHVTITSLEGVSTDITLAVSAPAVNVGDPLTFTATLTNAPKATGSVAFFDPAVGMIGTAPVIDGTATLSTFSQKLGSGVHHVQAGYSGSGPYSPNTAWVDVAVSKVWPSMQIGVNPTHVKYGTDPTITVTVPKDMAGEVLWFYDDQQGSLGPAIIDATGTAKLSKFSQALTVGVHHISASSDADAKYLANDTAQVTLTVTP